MTEGGRGLNLVKKSVTYFLIGPVVDVTSYEVGLFPGHESSFGLMLFMVSRVGTIHILAGIIIIIINRHFKTYK